MKFYQIDIITTTLGGSPCKDTHFFQVWDNAHKCHKQAIDNAIDNGYDLISLGDNYAFYSSPKTGATIEIIVYDRKFDD